MISKKNKFETVDEYINTFPKETQKILKQIRRTIKKAAPDAEEVISYQIPAFKLKKVLVYYAAYKNHIGFYPTAKPIKIFSKELSQFETSKGAVKFPLNKKIPFNLITKITKFRAKDEKQKIKK